MLPVHENRVNITTLLHIFKDPFIKVGLVIVSLGYSQQWIAFTKEASINSQEVRDLNANSTGKIRPVDVELNTNRISDSSHPFQSAPFSSFSR